MGLYFSRQKLFLLIKWVHNDFMYVRFAGMRNTKTWSKSTDRYTGCVFTRVISFSKCSRTCTSLSSNKSRFCVNTTEISKSVYIMLDEKVVFYRVFVFRISNTTVMNSFFF